MSSMVFEPIVSPALWMALAALAAVALIGYARSRPASASRLRWGLIMALGSAAMAGVLLIVLNPTWLEPVPPPAGKPLLTVLVDRSASMGVADEAEDQTRFASAVGIAARLGPLLSTQFDVEVHSFADGVATTTIEQLAADSPDGFASDLASALGGTLSSERPQGQAVLLISDGIHNGASGLAGLSDALRAARSLDVPVYTMTVGGDAELHDLEVALARTQELSFVGQTVPISVRVKQRGRVADRADVLLLKDGRELARESVPLTANASSALRFHVVEETSGLHRYEVKVEPSAEEAASGNNSAAFLLRVVDQPVRVLLLEGKPYWDAKFLVRTLAGDPSVEVDAVVRVAEGRFVMRSLRWPRTGERATEDSADRNGNESSVGTESSATAAESGRRVESTTVLKDLAWMLDEAGGLSSCQLLVLGRDSEVFLSDAMLDRLRTWISRDGGALVCYRGAPVATANQELARLLPVHWEPSRETRFRVQFTERGRELNWLEGGEGDDSDRLGMLPSLVSGATPTQIKPLSVVLARTQGADGPAVVTYQQYGSGRVVAVEGSGMWRWAFLAPQFQKLDETYSSLWQSLLRWLVSGVGLIPGQDLVLRTDKVTYTVGEQISTSLLIRPEAERAGVPQVELTADDGTLLGSFRPIPFGEEPGVYRIGFGPLPEGAYRARVVRTSAATDSAVADGSGGTVAFDVRSFSGERLDVRARPDLMERIAADSGGGVLSIDRAERLADEFQQHQSRSRPLRVRRLTAWDRWWVLTAILAMWAAAWALRRSTGLI